MPPSTNRLCPVTYPDWSEASQAAAAAICSTVPMVPIGTSFTVWARAFGSANFAALMGVSMAPGAMQFTRMPRCAYSSAIVSLNSLTPPLLAV